jgi:polyhydroxyalkanoate synthesis regulator phasin
MVFEKVWRKTSIRVSNTSRSMENIALSFQLRNRSIDHQKVVSKAELDNLNNQISILRRTMYQLSTTCNDKRNDIAYLKNQIQALEGYVNGLKNRNQQQQQQEDIQNES